MPHHNEGEIDAIDNINLEYSRALKQQTSRVDDLSRILTAMQIVARLDSTCEQLSKAANTVFDIFEKDSSFEPDWRSLKETLESRGLTVEIIRIGGICLGPSVRTKAGNKAKRNADRILEKAIQANNQQLFLSKQVPGMAPA